MVLGQIAKFFSYFLKKVLKLPLTIIFSVPAFLHLWLMKKKVIPIIPYIIILAIIAYCWVDIIILKDAAATSKHYIALGLVLVNGALYFKNYKGAILLTGAMLVIATFNLITFYPVTRTFALIIAGFNLPEIQYFSFFILIGYCIINFNLFIECYLDYKGLGKKGQ